MPRNPNNRLEAWETSLVKAMIAEGMLNDQDIFAWLTRPSRSINHPRIKEIHDGSKHKSVPAATADALAAYPCRGGTVSLTCRVQSSRRNLCASHRQPAELL